MDVFTEEHYLDGIQRAKNEGLVVGDAEIFDHYGHVKMGISSNNTRDLALEAADLIRMYEDGDDSNLLELGQGVGLACGQARRIAQPGSQIHSLALTPTNPWYMCRMRMTEILKSLVQRSEDESSEGSFCRDWMKEFGVVELVGDRVRRRVRRYPLGRVLDLQREAGIEIFTLLEDEEPFIDRGMVGGLPYGVDLPEDTYDVVYEDNGPFNKNDKGGRLDVLSVVVKSLTRRGVFFVCGHAKPLVEGYNDAVRHGILSSRDAVVALAGSRAGYVLAKDESPFLVSLRRSAGTVSGFYSMNGKDEAFYNEVMGNVN